MADAIVQIIAWVLAAGASIGIDALIGKWVAYFTIAMENAASDRARKAFADAVAAFKAEAKPNTAWDDWRRKAVQPAASGRIPQKTLDEVAAAAVKRGIELKENSQLHKE